MAPLESGTVAPTYCTPTTITPGDDFSYQIDAHQYPPLQVYHHHQGTRGKVTEMKTPQEEDKD